jgi:hypothetical protein
LLYPISTPDASVAAFTPLSRIGDASNTATLIHKMADCSKFAGFLALEYQPMQRFGGDIVCPPPKMLTRSDNSR